jgi:4-hydroxybenzoate polyprenyltransferase
MKVLKLMRLENLAMLAFVQLIFRYGFLEQQHGLALALNHWQYALLVLASVLIAAGGSLMESISGNDRHTAAVSEATGYNIYTVLTLLGVGIGYYISSLIGKNEFVAVFVVSAAMLYITATNFRQTMLVGNILVALTVALSIIIISIFNFYPFLSFEGRDYYIILFRLLLDYAIFGFLITLLYTLVTDLKNTDADYNSGKSTLPIAMGRDRTAKIVFGIGVIPMVLLVYYINAYFISLTYALIYSLVFILGPMIYFLVKLWMAKTRADFRHLGIILKMIMFFTALLSVVVTYNINANA